MSDISRSLFEGERLSLAPRDPERDPEIEAQWTHDPEYLHRIQPGPAIPQSPQFIRKRYEEENKDKRHFSFSLRTRADDRLVGFAALQWIEWTHQSARLTFGIGRSEDRDHGLEEEALALMLRYAFMELNLHRVSAVAFEYDQPMQELLARAGFQSEVRRREVIQRQGRRCDALHMGLLRAEWETGQTANE